MNHEEISQRLLAAPPSHCLIGFDGFTDDIYRVVDQRVSDGPNFISDIPAFAGRIGAAAGRSANLELVRQCRKIGGNGPIMAQALIDAGYQVILAGTIGTGEVEPVFEPLAKRCFEVLPLGNSGHSDCLEFDDGKIILGKLEGLHNIDARCLTPLDAWVDRIAACRLIAAVNWTMLPGMTSIWRTLCEQVGPRLPLTGVRRRWLFIDLADPAKRADEDLREALGLLGKLQKYFTVALGLNLAEAARLCQLFGKGSVLEEPASVERAAVALREQLHIEQVVVHPRLFAAGANREGSCWVEGPSIGKPKLTTGGGDNFNAGYCNGLLAGLGLAEALRCGVATSGFYVQQGRSPTREELVAFMAANSAVG